MWYNYLVFITLKRSGNPAIGFLVPIQLNSKISGPWDLSMALKRHLLYFDLVLVTSER